MAAPQEITGKTRLVTMKKLYVSPCSFVVIVPTASHVILHVPWVSFGHRSSCVTSCPVLPEGECIHCDRRDETWSSRIFRATFVMTVQVCNEWNNLNALTSPSANSLVKWPSNVIHTTKSLANHVPIFQSICSRAAPQCLLPSDAKPS